MKSKKMYIIGLMLAAFLMLCGCNDKKADDVSKPQSPAQTQQADEVTENSGAEDTSDKAENQDEAASDNSSSDNTASSDTTYSPDTPVEGGQGSSNGGDTDQSQNTSSGMTSVDWESDDVWGPKG